MALIDPHITRRWDKHSNPICVPNCPACQQQRKRAAELKRKGRMRITVDVDKDLYKRARGYTDFRHRSEVVNEALKALCDREISKMLREGWLMGKPIEKISGKESDKIWRWELVPLGSEDPPKRAALARRIVSKAGAAPNLKPILRRGQVKPSRKRGKA